MNKVIVLSTIILTIGLGFTSPAFSQTPTPLSCPSLYNGGIVCQETKDFSVDKKIQTPTDGSYVDLLPENETKVIPGRTMIFRIEVKNKTSRTLRNINVTDTLPGFVQFVKAESSVKQNGEKITYTIATLEAKKTSKVNIETKIMARESLPEGTGSVCVVNQVEAKSGFSNLARDFVTFCIDNADTAASVATSNSQELTFPTRSKGGQALPTTTPVPTQTTTTKGGQQVYPVSNTNKNPNTGPETLALIGLILGAAAGLWFRRKSRTH